MLGVREDRVKSGDLRLVIGGWKIEPGDVSRIGRSDGIRRSLWRFAESNRGGGGRDCDAVFPRRRVARRQERRRYGGDAGGSGRGRNGTGQSDGQRLAPGRSGRRNGRRRYEVAERFR